MTEANRIANTRHGHAAGGGETREYMVWHAMRTRCLNPAASNYRLYGGRGISICDRWGRFAAFLADMGPRPRGTTLDRIDVNGHYGPDNCRWSTPREQCANKRNNRLIAIDGVTKTITEWSRIADVSTTGIKYRLLRGVTGAALLGPSRRRWLRRRQPDTGEVLRERAMLGEERQGVLLPVDSPRKRKRAEDTA